MDDGLRLKLQYFEPEKRELFLNQDILKMLDELVALHITSAVIQSISNYTDNPDFLWESSFIELLSFDEKKKYRTFDLLSFSLNQYSDKNNVYDESLPYFSQVVRFVVLSKYIKRLKRELTYLQENVNDNNELSAVKNLTNKKSKIKKTFECSFNDQQIEILIRCINEARIFTEQVTAKILRQIFSCELGAPLRVRNNRLLAYFFVSLDDRSWIVHNWQSICETNQLFLSSLKGNILKQSDLSTATNECRNYPPKASAIIDNYIKELKKH